MSLPRTPSQTIGPFFAVGLLSADGPYAVAEGTPDAFWIRGQILDGAGAPVPDAMIETWQADPHGRFDRPEFRGFARCPTDQEGTYAIWTLKPGPLPTPAGGTEAPHLDVSLFARGLLKHVVTRIYFDDEPSTNGADPLLSSISDAAARATLIAQRHGDGYRFDIRLQGERETVFFAI
jgi:protocatechuate 3,4-dioxygenase alpha subunit